MQIVIYRHILHDSLLQGVVDLDRSRRIVATGSSSFTLEARTRESLAGRARRTRLLPLSLSEVSHEIRAGLTTPVRKAHLSRLWEKLLVTGGYPEVWLDDRPREFAGLAIPLDHPLGDLEHRDPLFPWAAGLLIEELHLVRRTKHRLGSLGGATAIRSGRLEGHRNDDDSRLFW